MEAMVSPSLICSSNSIRYWLFTLTDDSPFLSPDNFSYRSELYWRNPMTSRVRIIRFLHKKCEDNKILTEGNRSVTDS